MVVGLYYDLQVDYVTQLWEEFGLSISHTNVANKVSCVILESDLAICL